MNEILDRAQLNELQSIEFIERESLLYERKIMGGEKNELLLRGPQLYKLFIYLSTRSYKMISIVNFKHSQRSIFADSID